MYIWYLYSSTCRAIGRTHALKVACANLASATDEEKAYIGALMGGLEQDKAELASASFNPDDTATGFVSI